MTRGTWAKAIGALLMALLATTAAVAAEDAEVERRFGVVYAEQDGQKLRADIYLPRGIERAPGVLMIHGGSWMYGSRFNMLLHANTVARAGYVVVSIDYRLAPRYRYPAQLLDCREALEWMRANAAELKLDPQRIAVYGYSAGAQLACMLGLCPEGVTPDQAIEPVQAIVAGGTPCDFEWLHPRNPSLVGVFGGTRGDRPEAYEVASPLNYASANDPPVFLYHGTTDLLVPIDSARRLHERLSELGVASELVERPAMGHLAAFLDPSAPHRAVEFLDRVLRPARERARPASLIPANEALVPNAP